MKTALVDIKCVKNTVKGQRIPLTVGKVYKNVKLEYTKGITKDGTVTLENDNNKEEVYSIDFFKIDNIHYVN